MNKIKYIIILCSGLIFAGCEPSQEEIQNHNAYFKENPQHILTMPDGRDLYCLSIINDRDKWHEHFIYYFDNKDTNTISINSSVQEGKTTRIQTIVIDGKNYKLIPFIEQGIGTNIFNQLEKTNGPGTIKRN